ncbi:MAG: hypothetical protein WEF50_11040 [Myxococcota bacterium]
MITREVGLRAISHGFEPTRLAARISILEVRGPCPGCEAEQALPPPAKLPAIQRRLGCGAFLELEEG